MGESKQKGGDGPGEERIHGLVEYWIVRGAIGHHRPDAPPPENPPPPPENPPPPDDRPPEEPPLPETGKKPPLDVHFFINALPRSLRANNILATGKPIR